MPKCRQCGRDFPSEQSLKIHVGRMHGSKAARKARRSKAGAGGKFVCPDCGRSFKMALHLGRHRACAHAGRAATKPRRTKAKVARPKKATRRGAAARTARRRVAGVSLASLSVEQLLEVKKAVDARLKGIAQQVRQAVRR